MKGETNVSGGIGFGGLLLLLFIALKLTGYIHWSWWWVLSPIWIVPALILLFILCVALVTALVETNKEKNK